jgi:MoaE-MoaD fusion protein
MQINVLFFATIRNLIGQKRLTIELEDNANTIAHVRQEIINRYPAVTDNIKIALTAINEEFSFNNDTIKDGDEVAFFPPVSGGSDESANPPEIFLLPTEPINHDGFVASITTSKTGAVCLFSGMVRGKTNKEGHIPDTEYLEYEAYEPMALAKMKQVAQEIRQQWHKVEGIAIAQRIGRLEVGQNTVVIACSSPHRDDGCFEAARYGIDRLKEIVPVWKKEVGADGEAWIEGDYVPSTDDKQA